MRLTLYREKIKRKRQQSESFNAEIKKKERERKRQQRAEKAERLREGTSEPNVRKKARIYNRKFTTPARASARIRKRAQKARKDLPDDPVEWADTVCHVINTATPRRKSILARSTPSTDTLPTLLGTKRRGRPKKNSK